MNLKEYEALLTDVETRLDRLRALYEQWFQGIERLEPTVLRKEVERRLHTLRKEKVRNTGLRFRCQQLQQRFTTYTTYWGRTARQIEEGTYRRDLLRMRRRREEAQKSSAEQEPDKPKVFELELDAQVDDMFSAIKEDQTTTSPQSTSSETEKHQPIRSLSPFQLPSTPPLRMQSAETLPRSTATRSSTQNRKAQKSSMQNKPVADMTKSNQAASGDISRDKIQTIYKKYIEARKKNNERTDNIKIESLAKNVQGMMPKLQKKYAGKEIDFKVVLKDGRVALKPVVKGEES